MKLFPNYRDYRIVTETLNMKKILLFFLAALLAVSCGKNRPVKISGSFPGLDKEMVYLELTTTKERKKIDSAEINRKGNFSFRTKLPTPTPAFVNLICNQHTIPLIVSPGERVHVEAIGNLTYNYSVKGSPDSELLQAFSVMYNSGVATLDSLYYLYSETSGFKSDDVRRQELRKEYAQAYYRFKREHITFIVTHANSMASLYALYQRLPNDASLFNENDDVIYYRLVADSLSLRYPLSPHVIALRKEVESRTKAQELQQEVHKKMAEPSTYLDIELPDMFGKKQRLSSLEGKVVLIDFWSATDKRSSILNAELKELYADYHAQGFEVYQVSLDGDRSLWIEAVQGQKLPWISVNDPGGLAGTVARSYNVRSVPSNILLNREGTVMCRDQFGQELRNAVARQIK